MSDALHLGITLQCTAEKVYAFVRDARHLPLWAAGLASSEVSEIAPDRWAMASPLGSVEVAFCAKNTLGVLDHEVTLADGQRFMNPMRVVPFGPDPRYSEFSFTLFRQPGMSDADFARDRAAVEADLVTLKALLEELP
ncbi:SRPBCC family protein [Pokkaliibacter sp. CJK22405]|uniref:SRPBCC family protein n=1 Tax=Pokkaliibacter sp. CJK22405 TaxID=3384615 RepID=UPI003984F6BB